MLSRRLTLKLFGGAMALCATSALSAKNGEFALAASDSASGQIQGETGGAYAIYRFAYPGDGSKVEIRLDIGTSDVDVLRSTGVIIFGPTPGKTYVKSDENNSNPKIVSFGGSESGEYQIQVYTYIAREVPYSIAANVELRAQSGGGASTSDGKKTIVIDPGHGGPEIGAASPQGDLAEKNVNLKIALKLSEMLKAQGYNAVLTRDADRPVRPGYSGGVESDLQARIDIANANKADLFFCIHNNGGPSSESGAEVWYNMGRPFSDRNQKLARLLQDHLLAEIRATGYNPRDRGIKNDARFRIMGGVAYNIYVLSPGTPPKRHSSTHMPAVLGESLFMSNSADVAQLRKDSTIEAIARAYRNAAVDFFKLYP